MNSRVITAEQMDRYRSDGADQILWDEATDERFAREGIEIVRADLLDEGEMVRHDSARLARVVINCAANARSRLVLGELLNAN